MKYFKYIVASILLSYSSLMWSQQESIITQYAQNMNIINPAYAGVDNETVLSSSVRTQWSGVDDAPETQTLAFGTSLGKNVGLGLSMVRDKTFIEKQVFVGIDVSYVLKASATTDVYFGIKGGGNFYDVNTSGLSTYNLESDPSLESISNFTPNIGVGALLKRKKWYASFSVPRMLNTERSKNDNGVATAATDRPHMYFSSGYEFSLNKKESLFLRPSTLMRYVNGAPFSVDFNMMLSFNKKFDIGGTYRTDGAYAGLVAFSINKRFTFGFAYEMSTKSELARAQNTNEFLLRLKL